MPLSDRLHHVAVRGCLTAVLLCCLPPYDGSERYGVQRAVAQEKKDAERSAASHFAPGFKVDPHTYRAICDQPKDREHADLCQQWRVAEAADTQALLNVLGLMLIAGTLFFTAWTARAASRAAQAAVESSQIARKAQRPYFTPKDPELKNWARAIREFNEFQHFETWMDIENVGEGVGFLHSYGIAHEIVLLGKPFGSKELTVRGDIGRMSVAHDAYLKLGAALDAFQLDPADRLALINFDKTLYVYGYFRYFDLFGAYWRSGFMFEYIPNKDDPDKSSFVICPHPMWYDREEDEHGNPVKKT